MWTWPTWEPSPGSYSQVRQWSTPSVCIKKINPDLNMCLLPFQGLPLACPRSTPHSSKDLTGMWSCRNVHVFHKNLSFIISKYRVFNSCKHVTCHCLHLLNPEWGHVSVECVLLCLASTVTEVNICPAATAGLDSMLSVSLWSDRVGNG